MTSSFHDKVAIVTGGASGIGRGLCEALCRSGARVVVADIDLPRAKELASTLSANGGTARAAHVDVTNLDLVRGLVSDTTQEHGRLDYMFNNAAATATRGELSDLPIEPWRRAIDVNLLGIVHGIAAAYPFMIRQGFGHIVNTGSLAGVIAFPTSIPYGATKAAVVSLSLGLRMEAADLGVKVTVVCPGPVHGEAKDGHVRLIGVDRAVQRILRGVQRNRGLMVFPMQARLLWWLYRLSPGLFGILGRKFVRDYRAGGRAHPERSTARGT